MVTHNAWWRVSTTNFKNFFQQNFLSGIYEHQNVLPLGLSNNFMGIFFILKSATTDIIVQILKKKMKNMLRSIIGRTANTF